MLAPRVRGDGGIGEEATILSVLEKDSVERRGIAIRSGHGGREIVHDQAAHDPAEECPGFSCWHRGHFRPGLRNAGRVTVEGFGRA